MNDLQPHTLSVFGFKFFKFSQSNEKNPMKKQPRYHDTMFAVQ